MGEQNKTDRVWLITGCSTGIGREIANLVLASGQRAAVTARNPDSVADLVAASRDQISHRVRISRCHRGTLSARQN